MFISSGGRPGAPGYRTSSPLGQVAEESRYAESVDGELWELASMEYPGKADGMMYLQEEDEDFDPDEPRLREWLKYLVALCWLLGLGIGLPAALSSE